MQLQSQLWARIRMLLVLLLAATTLVLSAPTTTHADLSGGGDGFDFGDMGTSPESDPSSDGSSGDTLGCNLPGSVKGTGSLIHGALRIDINLDVRTSSTGATTGWVTLHFKDVSNNALDGANFKSTTISSNVICTTTSSGKRAILRAQGTLNNQTGYGLRLGIRDGSGPPGTIVVDQALVALNDGTNWIYNSDPPCLSSPCPPRDFNGDFSAAKDNNLKNTSNAYTITIE